MMNNSIRFSAKTVEDAVTDACAQLGVTSDRLEYEIIEKGSAGFLGIGMKQAVIEARRKVDTTATTEKREKKEYKPVVKAETKKEYKREYKAVTASREEKKETPIRQTPIKQTPIIETKKVEKKEVAIEVEKVIVVKEEREAKPLAKVSAESIAGVENFLKKTLQAMGMEVKITSGIDAEGALSVELEGENMGILIGKRGQTLDSLQYLTNRVANKYQEEYVRVKLDTENYRERREETLQKLARNLASKVKRTRRTVSLEPMNPYERRIIHSVLQSDPGVRTHSEGDEPYRKVVITYKR